MNVFVHHIYEYQKGLRNLILHTLHEKNRKDAVERLIRLRIPFHIQNVSESKINVFFGAPECIDVIKNFGDKPLNELSPEQDFILGTMLGYNLVNQCGRYLSKLKKENLPQKIA